MRQYMIQNNAAGHWRNWGHVPDEAEGRRMLFDQIENETTACSWRLVVYTIEVVEELKLLSV